MNALNPLGFLKRAESDLPNFKTPAIAEAAKDKIDSIGRTRGARRELEELLLKVELIEDDCSLEKAEDELALVKDEFIRLKRSMYNDVMRAKDMIRERYEVQRLRGNTMDAIQKGAKIREILNTLDADFVKLKEIFKKQTKQKKLLGEDELDQRFRDMQVLKRQIEDCRALNRNGGNYTEDEIWTMTDVRGQMRAEGIDPAKIENRELFDNEKEALARWADRDKLIDQGIDEVGQVVDRLGELAVNIGEKADQQAVIIKELNVQANDANEDLLLINTKIKSILGAGGSTKFCCRLLLALILVCQVAYLISILAGVVSP